MASIFGFEDLTVKFMGVPEGLHKASVRQVVPRVLAGPARQVAVRRSGSTIDHND